MTDIDLLVFGCAVSFIAACGAYVFARERFVYSEKEEEQAEQRREEPALGEPHGAHES